MEGLFVGAVMLGIVALIKLNKKNKIEPEKKEDTIKEDIPLDKMIKEEHLEESKQEISNI